MKNGSTLPALGLIAAASAAFGLQLGESAVEEIDPVHFRGPAIHPRDRGAAIDPRELAEPAGPRFASLYGWEEGNAARAEECWDCDALASPDPYAEEEAYLYPAEIEWEETIEDSAVYLDEAERRWAESGEEEPADFEEGRAEAERYTHYPITMADAAPDEEEEPTLVYYSEPAGG